MKKKLKGYSMIAWILGGFVAVVVAVILLGAIQIVPAGFRGILLEFGAPIGAPVPEGLKIVTPIIQTVRTMEVRTQKYQTDADSASKDLQSIISTVALNYHVDPSLVVEIYANIGLEYQDRIIAPAIEESVKASTARFTAEELITKREDLKTMIKEELKERLEEYGLIVETVSIVNFAFSEEFDRAIEAKVTAEQRALEAQRKLEQVKFEAQQAREKAQGEADAKLAIATAEAEAIKIQGEALRENPEVIGLRTIEKWDGILPVYMLGTDAVPFIQIPSQ